MKLFGTAPAPLPATSVFHKNNAKVNRDQTVMAAAAFFERQDRGGRTVKIHGSYGTKQKILRTR
jgi:hypothetical protein